MSSETSLGVLFEQAAAVCPELRPNKYGSRLYANKPGWPTGWMWDDGNATGGADPKIVLQHIDSRVLNWAEKNGWPLESGKFTGGVYARLFAGVSMGLKAFVEGPTRQHALLSLVLAASAPSPRSIVFERNPMKTNKQHLYAVWSPTRGYLEANANLSASECVASTLREDQPGVDGEIKHGQRDWIVVRIELPPDPRKKANNAIDTLVRKHLDWANDPDAFFPSSDSSHAMAVVYAMGTPGRSMSFTAKLTCSLSSVPSMVAFCRGVYPPWLGPSNPECFEAYVGVHPFPLAICIAALRALNCPESDITTALETT